MKRVDKFIFVTRIIKKDYIDNFKNIKNLKNGKVILNAFDPEDYPKTKKENDSSNNMVFTYTGRIYGRRNIDNFICAIGEIIESGSIFKGGVEINIVGDIDKKNLINIKSLVNKFKLESIVKIVGVLSHSECIKCQSNSSFNIIIAHDIGSEYAIPSKLFEYIAAKKPIVAVSEDPLVIEIMEKYKLGLHCRNNSEDIKNVLLQIMRNEFEYNETTIPEEFKRDSQIRKITEFITS
jgi:glycosyltransferase involved in cell wall biosynthesis